MPNEIDDRFFPSDLRHALGFVRMNPEAAQGDETCATYAASPAFTHTQGRVVQGGYVTAWLDNAMALAAHQRDPAHAIATLDIRTSFMAPVGLGEHLVRARVVTWGKSIAFLEASVEKDGRVLAKSSSTVKLRLVSGAPRVA